MLCVGVCAAPLGLEDCVTAGVRLSGSESGSGG